MCYSYYSWFLDIWCNFLQGRLPHLLTTLRKGMAMIASGFQILQDFMDVTFQGVLPAEFIAKYGDKLFQSRMLEKYSDPTSRKSKYITKVESSLRVYTQSFSRIAKSAATAVKGLGIVGTVIGVGIGLYDAYNDIQGALDYPSNFTLFDFSAVFDGIDSLESFVSNDQRCLTYSVQVRYGHSPQLFTCFSYSLFNNPALDNLAATAIAPTPCWANAQTSLGQSNLFSCHSGSTCCPDNDCATPIMCDACPTPKFDGEVRFACNTILQQCQCAVAVEAYTPCASNQQCGTSSQCMLASLSSGVSYGTIPCGQCPTHNVFCSIPPAGFPGQCTCYTDSLMPKALCSDTSGAATVVSGTQLCGYAPDATASSSVWQFSLDQLAMVQCMQAQTKICSTVWLTASSSIKMAVAVPPLLVSGGGGRRRLLWEDPQGGGDPYTYDGDYEPFGADEARAILEAPGWEATAAPCAELVRRHRRGEGLGTLERHALHQCAYWRFVGRRVVETLNLTALAPHETFLLSAEDLAAALSHPAALVELVTSPWALVYALAYHPWARPLRAAATVLANTAERTEWARRWLEGLGEDGEEGAEELLEFVTGGEGPAGELRQEHEGMLNWTEWRAGLRSRRLVNPRPPSSAPGPSRPDQARRRALERVAGRRPGRGLLSVNSDIQLVQAMSASIATGGDPNPPVPQQVAQVWGEGPFLWPPRYQYGLGACPVGVSIVSVSAQALGVLVQYYANWDRPPPPIDRSLRATLPQLGGAGGWTPVPARPPSPARARGWASALFHRVTGLLGLGQADISSFFVGSGAWSLQWLAEEMVLCDLAAVVSCSRHKRDLIMSLVVFVAAYVTLQAVASATGLSVLSTVFFYSAPGLLLWYVYGVGPTCFPLLPTCLLSDVIAAAEYVAPEAIALPPELLCDQPAGNTSNQPAGNTSCLRPCSELNFTSWQDTLAFAVCDTDAGWCEALGHAGENVSWYQSSFGPLFAPLQVSARVPLKRAQVPALTRGPAGGDAGEARALRAGRRRPVPPRGLSHLHLGDLGDGAAVPVPAGRAGVRGRLHPHGGREPRAAVLRAARTDLGLSPGRRGGRGARAGRHGQGRLTIFIHRFSPRARMIWSFHFLSA